MPSKMRSAFARMSGAEYEVQEALVALRRVLDGDLVRPSTRVALQAAFSALREESEDDE